MAQTPKYPLTDVMPLIEECVFSAASCSTYAVIAVFRQQGGNLTQDQAEEWIRKELKQLKNTDFFQRTIQWGVIVADVYGKVITGQSWYIKFIIEDGRLDSISFHPSEKDMVLQSGTKLNKGNFYYDDKSEMWRMR